MTLRKERRKMFLKSLVKHCREAIAGKTQLDSLALTKVYLSAYYTTLLFLD